MACYSRRIEGLRVQLHNDVAALAVPSGGAAGAAVPATWKDTPLNRAYRLVHIEIIGDALGARTLTDVTVYGYDGTNWWAFWTLNNGLDIVLGATAGYSEEVPDAGVWQRLALSADAISGGNVDVFATPYDTAELPG